MNEAEEVYCLASAGGPLDAAAGCSRASFPSVRDELEGRVSED